MIDIIHDWETSEITEGIHTQEERKTERRRAEQNGDQYPARNDSATAERRTTAQHSTQTEAWEEEHARRRAATAFECLRQVR